MGGKGASSTVTVHNGPVTVDSDSTVEVVGLNDIKLTLQPSPLKTESKQELIFPQPLKTETRLDTKSDVTSDSKNAIAVDLKPIAMDVCLNTSTQLPHGQISNPFSLHLGMTWMGVELFGLNLGGESRTVMQDLPKKPTIDWPAQQNAGPSGGHGHHHDTAPATGDRGLRVRIK
ncbi:MAG TPA: hypothetical protein VI485_08895 [Vicinamibacterales bacterium]|nr:hypothetical protein [Vicinamibacterales bacterium]